MSTPQTIKARHADLHAAQEKTATLQQLLASLNPGDDTTAQNDVARLTQAFEDVCAAHSLGEATDDQVSAARHELDEAHAAARAVASTNQQRAAAAAGVERRLAAAQAAADSAAAALRAAEIAWALSEAEAADRLYVEHGRAAAAAAARVTALHRWLNGTGHRIRYPMTGVRVSLLPIGPASVRATLEVFPKSGTLDAPNFSFPICKPVDEADALEVVKHELAGMKPGERTGSVVGRVVRGALAIFSESKAA